MAKLSGRLLCRWNGFVRQPRRSADNWAASPLAKGPPAKWVAGQEELRFCEESTADN
jgi:hypothetical protein